LPPITKSQFKLGLDCIQKLRHARNNLPQVSQDDDMLRLLSEGGAAVEALVLAVEPGQTIGNFGEEALQLSMAAIRDAFAAARAGTTTPLYEVTIAHDGFLARIDLLRISPEGVHLVEIKAKTTSLANGALPEADVIAKSGAVRIKADWLPYIQDVAFQTELLERWLAAHADTLKAKARVSPRLLLVNKDGAAQAHDVLNSKNYISQYRQGTRGIRATVTYRGPGVQAGTQLIAEVPVDQLVAMLRQNAQSTVGPFANRSIGQCMDAMKAIVTTGAWPDVAASRSPRCKTCEFRVKPPLESGFDRCWGDPASRPAHHFIELTRISAKQFGPTVDEHGHLAAVADVAEDVLSDSQKTQHRAVLRNAPLVDGAFADAPLARMLTGAYAGHSGAIHFVDFETSAYPIPARVGGRAYEHAPFQFEGHSLESAAAPLSARVRLDGFLELQNPDPRRDFVDALMKQFGSSGPVFHWHHFERGVLNGIKKALTNDNAPGDAGRIAFIDSMVGPEGKGGGRLVDLLPIAKTAFYSPAMAGSYSIKRVVPIAWAIPDIRQHFIEGHGAQGDPDHYSGETDPYDGLPNPPQSILEAVGGIEAARRIVAADDDDDAGGGGAVRNGGMAMLAYHYVKMFGGADDPEIVAQFRRYCRLDSAAMVMVFGLMRDHVRQWQRM
jgi:hypothetical protein